MMITLVLGTSKAQITPVNRKEANRQIPLSPTKPLIFLRSLRHAKHTKDRAPEHGKPDLGCYFIRRTARDRNTLSFSSGRRMVRFDIYVCHQRRFDRDQHPNCSIGHGWQFVDPTGSVEDTGTANTFKYATLLPRVLRFLGGSSRATDKRSGNLLRDSTK